jgi:hypothetical protein
MKIIVTEEQIKEIIKNVYDKNVFEQTIPKNVSYSTTRFHVLSKTLSSKKLEIPNREQFTSHQSGKGGATKYWASIDEMKGNKLTYKVIYWCNGSNAGKFWGSMTSDPKDWYYDDTRILSGYLSKNVCNKAYGDQYRAKNAKKWTKVNDKNKKIADQKKEEEYLRLNSPYVDATGKKVRYWNSTEFKKNYNFLKGQGLVVDGVPNPQSPNQHFNLCALYSIKYLTDYQLNRLGWRNTECLQIGLASLGNVKMVKKKLNSYGISITSSLNDKESPIWSEITGKVKPLYANFVLSDFYFQWGKLVNDINANPNSNNTVYFPDGVLNFMNAFYGTTNASQLKNVYDKVRPSCVGGGLTAEEGHKVIEGLQIASMFVPVIGPFLAAGLGVADSAIYFSQGKKGAAGLVLALSVIPFAAEIPALKTVGKAVFESIALKTVQKIPFNVEELNVVKLLNAHKAEVKVATEEWIAKQSSNKTVQEFIKIAKTKGEDAIKDQIEKKTGIKLKYIPTSNAALGKLASSEAKSGAKELAKDVATKVAKSVDAPTTPTTYKS